MLRKGIEHSETLTIPISEEIEYLRSYVEIEQLRFPDLFKFELEADQELLDTDQMIPPQLIQPLVENAIKHAFVEKKNEPGLISVKFELESEKVLKVTVEDNGIGFNNKVKDLKHNSKGISIVQNQLAILNQGSDLASTIEIIDKAEEGSQGTRVVLRIATYPD